MDVILGGTGHVGRAVVKTVLAAGHDVTVVSRRASSASGGEFSTVALDVTDTSALRALFQKARRVFVLNPPAAVSGNTDIEERRTVRSILKALQGIRLEKLVVQSTYGAQPGEHCGDLGVLYELEQGARRLDVTVCIVRAAYYMSNWAGLLESAKATGVMKTLLPSAQAFPMVAPEDVGHFAGQMLLSDEGQSGIYNIEGPKAYTPDEVAGVFSDLLGRSVQVESVSQDQWYATYLTNGFSAEAARSYAAMTGLFVHQRYELPVDPHRGPTDLETCLRRFL
ncbi:NmrA family NAD(P)-binding protein [Gluconobacter thailandicus]|jgi:uncharacterized protein YbjT (DUF2867 family)|uniref:NAD(P)H-binding protein n=1 Tax=Gluconobacter thailandicus TaxID=257438 RepID=A0AAP9ESH4_GLUTH|nr:NmrA family NAD(P)-binding protein [Gluconobacter thailandicus]KXV33197.1 NmrA family transcriptional regulator [Gluconobacter thailandicus]QEH96506.1 NAD(P)H-binding protein [Gluconobacter thailandicus]